jgi:predicted DNA-binding transcriptional regulator YafY
LNSLAKIFYAREYNVRLKNFPFANIQFVLFCYLCPRKVRNNILRTYNIMPTNKNAIVRYKILDDVLSDRHHYYDINDITDIVNDHLIDYGYADVTRRCIEKDLNFLESAPFYADLTRERIGGKSRIRYTKSDFSIFSKELTDDEESLLAEVLNTLGQFDGLIGFDQLEGLRLGLGLKERQKIISFSGNAYLKNSNMLSSLFSFISNKQVINVTYHTFADPTQKTIAVYPYLLKQYNDRWYLICADIRDNFVLNFALDRIDNCEALPEKSYKEYDGDIFERFEDIIGVTLPKDAECTPIIIWVSNKQLPYILTKPIHGSQRIPGEDVQRQLHAGRPDLEGGTFVELNCVINTELKQNLFSFIDSVVVVSPLSLAAEMKEKITNLAKKYG